MTCFASGKQRKHTDPEDPTIRRLALFSTIAVLLLCAPAAATGPDSHSQPLLDGCQRSDAMELGLSTPEWVYVDRAQVLAGRAGGDTLAGTRTITGVVTETRPAGEDLYVNHDYNDMNVMLQPVMADQDVLGTGNGGQIETEWEASKIPPWAWPSVGDIAVLRGSWIWDCGHWGNSAADPTGLSQFLPYDPVETAQDIASPGAIRGEETELHPLDEVATLRHDAAGPLRGSNRPVALSRLDVWINGDGGPALAEEECALHGIQSGLLARAFCPQTRDVGGDYSFTIPLGPSPGRGSKILTNPVLVHPESDSGLATVPVSLVADRGAGTVTVRFSLPHSSDAQRFGITVEAGWSRAPAAVHHVVTLDGIHVERSLDGSSEPNHNPASGPEQTPDPGEWVLYAQVSGQWVQVPGVAQVHDDQTTPLGITFSFWLPQGVPPTLYVAGRECDVPIIDCTHETYGAPGDLSAPFQELGFNDHPGRIEQGTAGVPLSPGSAVYRPTANPDPGSGNEDLSDTTCGPKACYQMTVTST